VAEVSTYGAIVPPFESPTLAWPGNIKDFLPAPAEEVSHY